MRGLLLIAGAAVFIAGAVCAQPEKKSAPTAPAVSNKKAPAVADYKLRPSDYGRKARCAVSGEEFKVGPETKAVKYKGKVYYFCCADCMPQFKKNPAKYAK